MRVLAAATVLALLAAPTALAAPPDLSRHGITVVWPERNQVPANAPFEVKVQSKRERVSLRLARYSESGRLMRVLARKTVRNGGLKVTLPATVGARYRVTLAAVDREWSEEFRTTCAPGGTPGVEASVTPNAARSGDRVVLRMHNTGTACLAGGSGYSWERQAPDGTWVDVPLPPNHGWTLELRHFTPGTWWGQPVWVWPTEAGSYRITKGLGGAGVALPFTILP